MRVRAPRPRERSEEHDTRTTHYSPALSTCATRRRRFRASGTRLFCRRAAPSSPWRHRTDESRGEPGSAAGAGFQNLPPLRANCRALARQANCKRGPAMMHAQNSSSIAKYLTFAAALFVLSASPAFGYDAQVGWSPVSGASGYKVYVGPRRLGLQRADQRRQARDRERWRGPRLRCGSAGRAHCPFRSHCVRYKRHGKRQVRFAADHVLAGSGGRRHRLRRSHRREGRQEPQQARSILARPTRRIPTATMTA